MSYRSSQVNLLGAGAYMSKYAYRFFQTAGILASVLASSVILSNIGCAIDQGTSQNTAQEIKCPTGSVLKSGECIEYAAPRTAAKSETTAPPSDSKSTPSKDNTEPPPSASKSVPSPENRSKAQYYLQQGHQEKRKGNLDEAIALYKKSLEAVPGLAAAEMSLKLVQKQQKQKIQSDKMDPECRKSTSDIEEQKRCLEKYFSFSGHPIHPKIIQDFSTWMSDGGDQVVAINLNYSQNSNRYCCQEDVDFTIAENGKVSAAISSQKGESLRYIFHGKTTAGIYVLEVYESGGGSGVFGQIMLLKTSEEFRLSGSPARDLVEQPTPSLVKSTKQNIHLRKFGNVTLGDRESHKIDIVNGALIVDDKEINIPPL